MKIEDIRRIHYENVGQAKGEVIGQAKGEVIGQAKVFELAKKIFTLNDEGASIEKIAQECKTTVEVVKFFLRK